MQYHMPSAPEYGRGQRIVLGRESAPIIAEPQQLTGT